MENNQVLIALEALVQKFNDYSLAYWESQPEQFKDAFRKPVGVHAKHKLMTGKKYYKVVREGSAMAFVDKETGNIYKAATWAAPAKHARGNVLSEKGGEEAVHYDMGGIVFVNYLR